VSKCTVSVTKLFRVFQNCTQAHEDRTYVLLNINLYLLIMPALPITYSVYPKTQFCLSKLGFCLQIFTKKCPQKNSWGYTPHPLLIGLRSSHPPRWVLNLWLQWCLLTLTVHLPLYVLFVIVLSKCVSENSILRLRSLKINGHVRDMA